MPLLPLSAISSVLRVSIGDLIVAHIGGYARALKSRRQLRYVIRLPALLAELCRIVHR
jgi:hypothetical protein